MPTLHSGHNPQGSRPSGLLQSAPRDLDLALNASLNLKTKSWLVGALRMNQLCSELELALALGGWAAASAVARDIAIHIPRPKNALEYPVHTSRSARGDQ
jgi:hypothetical protein